MDNVNYGDMRVDENVTYLFALVIDMNFESGIFFLESVKSPGKVGCFDAFWLERK